jgi:hypothetical protein
MSLTFSEIISDGQKDYNTKYTVSINKEYLKFMDKNKNIISKSDNIIEQLLLNQKQIFETLMAQMRH